MWGSDFLVKVDLDVVAEGKADYPTQHWNDEASRTFTSDPGYAWQRELRLKWLIGLLPLRQDQWS